MPHSPTLRRLFGQLLDSLGIARLDDVDMHAVYLGLTVSELQAEVEELRARVDEFVGVKPVEDVEDVSA